MSSNYSANQYESAYSSQRLQNWCVSKATRRRPTALEGRTTFIANDRGHLLPGVAKKGNSWPVFRGTWGAPTLLHPDGPVNPTSRSAEGLRRLAAREGAKPTGKTQPPEGSKETASPRQVEHITQQDFATPPTPRRSAAAAAAAASTHPTPPPQNCEGDVPADQEDRPQPQNTGEVLVADREPPQ